IRAGGAQSHLPLIPQRSRPWALWLADAETTDAHAIWHSSNDLNGSLPPFAAQSLKFADGGRIIFCSEQDGRNHLYAVPTSGGQPSLLTPGDFDVEDVTLAPDNQSILYTSNQNDVDRRHIWRVSASGGTPQALSQGKTIEWGPQVLNDGKTIVCMGSTATSPAMPYRLTTNGREMIARNALPNDFPLAQLVEPQQVTFRSEDGLEIHGQLFVPRNVLRTPAAKTPALIFVHGGP